MDEPREVRNEDGTVPKWARRVTDTFVDATGIRDAKYRELVESIEAAEKATNGVFSSKSAGGILDMNAYREMEEEDRIAMGIEQARRNAEAAQLAKLRAERDRIDEEAARARIKAATEASLAAAPRDKKKADAAGAPFKLVKVVKKKPTPAKRTTEETETGDGDDAGGLRGLLGGYGSDDSADGVDVALPTFGAVEVRFVDGLGRGVEGVEAWIAHEDASSFGGFSQHLVGRPEVLERLGHEEVDRILESGGAWQIARFLDVQVEQRLLDLGQAGGVHGQHVVTHRQQQDRAAGVTGQFTADSDRDTLGLTGRGDEIQGVHHGRVE